MSQRIVTECDECADSGKAREAVTREIRALNKAFEVDLCDEHEGPLAALVERLAHLGRPVGTLIARATCPRCNREFATAQALGRHARKCTVRLCATYARGRARRPRRSRSRAASRAPNAASGSPTRAGSGRIGSGRTALGARVTTRLGGGHRARRPRVNNAPYGVDELGGCLGCLVDLCDGVGGDFVGEKGPLRESAPRALARQARTARPRSCGVVRRVAECDPRSATGGYAGRARARAPSACQTRKKTRALSRMF